MEIPLLRDIIVICGLALGVAFVCHRFAIPDTVGFLLTGILAGPHCMGLINNTHQVEQMAEIGVVCLLFAIGLEFSFKSLLKIKTMVLVGGAIQVGLSIVAGALLAGAMGMDRNHSIFFGFLLSLSSTAIVLKILQQRAETESPHGRLTLGILIFQDVAVVAMMLAAPIMVGKGSSLGAALLVLALKAIAIFLIVWISTKWVAPRFLFQVARLRNRQLFLLGIVLVARGYVVNIRSRSITGPRGFHSRPHRFGIRIQRAGPRGHFTFQGFVYQFLFCLHRHASGRKICPE